MVAYVDRALKGAKIFIAICIIVWPYMIAAMLIVAAFRAVRSGQIEQITRLFSVQVVSNLAFGMLFGCLTVASLSLLFKNMLRIVPDGSVSEIVRFIRSLKSS